MKYNSFLKSPKKEEQEVPDTVVPQLSNIKEESYGNGEIDVVDELEGIFGIGHDEMLSNDNMYGQLGWDFMDLEEYPAAEDEEGSEMFKFGDSRSSFFEFEESHYSIGKVKKEESFGFGDGDGDGDEKGASLNLNLNYQEVLEAWSDRGPLLADDHSLSTASNGHYMGEVPVMEEDRTRREASVLRYKEKRQTRLFSKKIRYQVRKLNADKRPRLKGRFVKRVA
ncbi:zinc finger proteinNSTANS-LIKE 16-like [Populus alba x Populus x berolinensis]|nr:zinc finger proteinNSTANS-LIKE 16-like [Populus alba x Populus x berolinensis]